MKIVDYGEMVYLITRIAAMTIEVSVTMITTVKITDHKPYPAHSRGNDGDWNHQKESTSNFAQQLSSSTQDKLYLDPNFVKRN